MRCSRVTAYLVMAALLLAACGGGATPTPSSEPPLPTAASISTVTNSPLPPTPTSTSSSSPESVKTRIRPADGMTMVYAPDGSFSMGSAGDDPEANPDEMPRHTVTLSGFWIDQTEVTNAQFVRFLNEHGNGPERWGSMIVLDQGYAQIKEVEGQFLTSEAAADRPVVMVTWYGAQSYCAWAGGRLPTEAEWEYAARGSEGHPYTWGDDSPTCELANHDQCSGVPVEVGRFPENASWCGVLDMSGNVWEWVSDWFGPYSDQPQENPTGPPSGEMPVLRGGGWHSPPRELRAAYRQHDLGRIQYNG